MQVDHSLWIEGGRRKQSKCHNDHQDYASPDSTGFYLDQVSHQGGDKHRIPHHLFKVLIHQNILSVAIITCQENSGPCNKECVDANILIEGREVILEEQEDLFDHMALSPS